MTTYTLNILVTGKDDASPALKRADSAVGGLGNAAGLAASLGVAALAAGLAALTVVAGKVVSSGMEFEKTMSGVQAVLSPTTDEMDALNATAMRLGAETAFSAQDAASGMEMLAKNGLNASQILGGAADASLNLAAATGTDLATAANIATDAMSLFGISAEDMSTAINGISGVTVSSKFGIDDYALALAQGGGVASAVGVSFQDFNATIAGIAPLFASGSDAGTSFKTFLQRLVPTTNDARDAMRDLGLITEDGANAFYNADGSMKSMQEIAGILQTGMAGLSDEQKTQALTTIFGTDAMRAAEGIARLGADAFGELQAQIGQVDAGEQARTRMDNLSGSMESLKGSLETVGMQIYQQVGPALKFFVDSIIPIVNEWGPRLATWLGDTLTVATREANSYTEKLGDTFAWLRGIAAQVGEWFATRLMPVISDLGTQFGTMLAPHVARLAELFKNDLWPIISEVARVMGQALVGALQILGPLVVGLVDVGLSSLELALTNLATVYTYLLKPALSGLWDWLTTLVGGWDTVVRGAGVARDGLSQLAQLFQRLGVAIRGVFRGDMGGLADIASSAMMAVKDAIAAWFGAFTDVGGWLIAGLKDGMLGAFGRLRDETGAAFSNYVDDIRGWLGIGSPSKVLMEIGAFTAEGFQVGMQRGIPGIEAASAGMAAATTTGMTLPGTAAGSGTTDGGGGGMTVIVNVAGSVTTEYDLAMMVRTHLLDYQRLNVATGLR